MIDTTNRNTNTNHNALFEPNRRSLRRLGACFLALSLSLASASNSLAFSYLSEASPPIWLPAVTWFEQYSYVQLPAYTYQIFYVYAPAGEHFVSINPQVPGVTAAQPFPMGISVFDGWDDYLGHTAACCGQTMQFLFGSYYGEVYKFVVSNYGGPGLGYIGYGVENTL